MGRMGICFTSVATSWWGEACCLLLCFPTGTCVLYSCLCTSFVSCYCVLMENIDKNGSVVTINHFTRLRVGSLLVSFGDSNVWPGRLLQATVGWGVSSEQFIMFQQNENGVCVCVCGGTDMKIRIAIQKKISQYVSFLYNILYHT